MLRRVSTYIGVGIALAAAAAAWPGCAHQSPSTNIAAEKRCDEATTTIGWGASSVSVVCFEDFRGIPVRQVEELLEGRVPGLLVVREAGGVSLRIRGESSILGSNEPLYVLDGMPLQMEPGRGLYWMSPRDIERIEVLKDPSATSMYGVRGANGVVLITTRRR